MASGGGQHREREQQAERTAGPGGCGPPAFGEGVEGPRKRQRGPGKRARSLTTARRRGHARSGAGRWAPARTDRVPAVDGRTRQGHAEAACVLDELEVSFEAVEEDEAALSPPVPDLFLSASEPLSPPLDEPAVARLLLA